MSVLQNAQAHFKEILAGGLKGPVHVPEWNTDIYFKASTTLAQESKIYELQNQGKGVEALVTSLILRALDQDGKPVFLPTDKIEIMRTVDPQVILRVIADMNENTSTDVREEALKN